MWSFGLEAGAGRQLTGASVLGDSSDDKKLYWYQVGFTISVTKL
jgi:hypothetical protein